ncbi:hypothetical protein N7470_010002 [Penicillium chermesinum]|nr:hypothetical protein N7470_010002 [Penicillium chermesinum]
MSVIGSLIFCTDCGNLLRESTGDANAILHCNVCGTRNKDTIPQTIISESKPSSFPSALRAKRSAVQTLSAEDRKTEAVIKETCENVEERRCSTPLSSFVVLMRVVRFSTAVSAVSSTSEVYGFQCKRLLKFYTYRKTSNN